MRVWCKGRGARLAVLLALLILWTTACPLAVPASANPFEVLPEGHWAYATVRSLSRKGFVPRYVADRLSLGYKMSYFDLAVWLGEAVQSLTLAEGPPPTVDDIVDVHNRAHPDVPLSESERRELGELLALVRDQLEILGYPIPVGVAGNGHEGIRLDGVAQALERFRMRGESRIVYQDIQQSAPEEEERRSSNVEHSYALHLSGALNQWLNVGAAFYTESKFGTGYEQGMFRVAAPGVDLGVPGAAVARFGPVTGAGLSELAAGGVRELSGFQAAFQSGQLGSTLLVARARVDGLDPTSSATAPLITAVDGLVRVTDRLQLEATMAYRSGGLEPSADGEGNEETAVVSVAGTYAVLPQLTLTTEVAQNPTAGDGGGALKVGAVVYPAPEVTLGALLSSFGEGYRTLLGSETGPRSRVDLSAEIGRWILSLRREQLVTPQGEDGQSTRWGLASYVDDYTIVRAARELSRVDGGEGDEPAVLDKTELGLEIRFELGKLGLDFAVEGAKGEPSSTVRRTRATLEHAVGPIGRASAGIAIVDQELGRETASNLGIRYDFDDASVALRYEILTKVGEVTENVTTAEVSIKF